MPLLLGITSPPAPGISPPPSAGAPLPTPVFDMYRSAVALPALSWNGLLLALAFGLAISAPAPSVQGSWAGGSVPYAPVVLGSTNPKGAIHINESARPYQFREEMSATYYQSGVLSSNRASATQYILYGKAYDPGVMGIKVYLEDNYDQPTAVSTHTAALTWPWSAPDTVGPLAGYVTPFKSRLEFDNLRLTRDSACNAVLSFTAARWYVQEILQASIGPQSQSFAGFDLRLDVVELYVENTPHPSVVEGAPPACAADFASQLAWDQGGSSFNLGGWRWFDGAAWQTDTVALDPLLVLPVLACTCPRDLGRILVPDSWDMQVEDTWVDTQTKTDNGVVVCPCPTGSASFAVWHGRHATNRGTSWIHGIPTTSGIKKHFEVGFVSCSAGVGTGTSAENDDTVIRTITYSEFDRRAHGFDATGCCQHVIVTTCAPPP